MGTGGQNDATKTQSAGLHTANQVCPLEETEIRRRLCLWHRTLRQPGWALLSMVSPPPEHRPQPCQLPHEASSPYPLVQEAGPGWLSTAPRPLGPRQEGTVHQLLPACLGSSRRDTQGCHSPSEPQSTSLLTAKPLPAWWPFSSQPASHTLQLA